MTILAGSSGDEFLGDGKGAAEAEGARSNFDSGRSLLALVFAVVDFQGDVANQVERKAEVRGDFFGRAQFLDIGFEDAVEDVIGRQSILIGLVGAQLGGGRLFDARAGHQFPFAIDDAREFVDHGFRHIGNYRQASGYIAVQGAVTDADFGFVSRAQNQSAEFIGESHEQIAADAGLDILLGGVFGRFGEGVGEDLAVGGKYIGDRQDNDFDSEIGGELARVAKAAFGGVGAGHGDAGDVLLAQRGHGDAGDHGRIHAAAHSHEHFAETAFVHVVARAGDERLERKGGFAGGLRTEVAFAGERVEDDDVFFKRAGLRGDAAVGGERDARAVEYQGIVAAHLVHVNHGTTVRTRQRAQHLQTHMALFDGVRRGGDIQDDAGSLPHEIDDRVGFVEALGPEIFVVPDVLADGDAELFAAEGENLLAGRRLED